MVTEYLAIVRDDEQLLLHLEAPLDSFLDVLNDLKASGFRYTVISEETYYYLRDVHDVACYTAN